ncbi:MAG: hypothetical protein CMJ83_10025 [Planctomycetes bacterium]|nr:hypothetical protein [Planctomycetota bacterium]
MRASAAVSRYHPLCSDSLAALSVPDQETPEMLRVCALLLFAIPALVPAQPGGQFAATMPWSAASGIHSNATDLPHLADVQTLRVPGAPSIRVIFAALSLGPDDAVVVSSGTLPWTHRITAAEARKWRNRSAWFNGDTVRVELWVAPGSVASWRTDRVGVGIIAGARSSICGTDTRVPSVDTRITRLITGTGLASCSGFLMSSDDCVATAGHCFNSALITAEFMVPPSLPSGAVQHPTPQFQFPMDLGTLTTLNNGTGNDWALVKLLPNNLGQTASATYGFLPLASAIPTSGAQVRLTGYGVNTGVLSQTLQTDVGPFVSAGGTFLTYRADTTGGNSGSPVVDELSGLVIAIHTVGGCTATAGANGGTSVLQAGFQSALAALCSTAPPPLAQVNLIGSGCIGSNGLPLLDSAQLPTIGNASFSLDVTQAVAGSQAWLYLSLAAAAIPITLPNGCGLYLEPASLNNLILLGVSPIGPVPTGATGTASFPLPVPNDPAIAGISVWFQAAIADAGGPQGFVVTNGLETVLN